MYLCWNIDKVGSLVVGVKPEAKSKEDSQVMTSIVYL